MSYYRESDGTIVVNSDCEHLIKEHIGFQMGTVRREDGRFVLLDPDLLSMCGKRVPRPHTRRPPRFKSMHQKVNEDLMDELMCKLEDQLPENCPRKQSECKFYNEVFEVCSAKKCVNKQEGETNETNGTRQSN